MVYSYTTTYYSSLHDSIASLCKTLLPFSFKKRRLPPSEQKLSKQQSDNLKWQQDSFHQILNLIGLQKEGIVGETEVSAFKTLLLETLIAAPTNREQPEILRDKLLFLQELFYAKCITPDEYHASKRPLLQRLAVQGAEIDSRDIIVANPKELQPLEEEEEEEQWSVIDLKDENSLHSKESSNSKYRSKHGSAMKQIKEAASIFGFTSSSKKEKSKGEKGVVKSNGLNKKEYGVFRENPFWESNLKEKESETQSILMSESHKPMYEKAENVKKKPFRNLFLSEHSEGNENVKVDEDDSKSGKNKWGFDGIKKWKRRDSEDETAPLQLDERSDSEAFMGSCKLVESPIGEGPNTEQIKKKLHSNGSSSDFFIDKVLGEKIKRELSRIQTELNTTNPNIQFSNDQIEAISTRLPVDKADLKKFFPRSWCDRYGDVVLDVVRKEFKDHVGELENLRNNAREKHGNSSRWTTFDDDENCNPNLFPIHQHSVTTKQGISPSKVDHPLLYSINNSHNFGYNPFADDYSGSKGGTGISDSRLFHDQTPFWRPAHTHI
ncbi:hypothetical protein RJ641_025507 [Dillenia turbinata]|uniref:Uncharacterized protein n=1 Tax=Dillenia turbinata TaxID=194707 RepID=A0AAN8W1Q9_9MAGN